MFHGYYSQRNDKLENRGNKKWQQAKEHKLQGELVNWKIEVIHAHKFNKWSNFSKIISCKNSLDMK